LTDWGASLWLIAVALEFVAFLIGGINFVTTSMNARAPGMRMTDIPMVVWMIVLGFDHVHGFSWSIDSWIDHASDGPANWYNLSLFLLGVVIQYFGSTYSGFLVTQRYM
jgi:hypothetical protein